ncbi:MAG: penicillin-binding protein 2 [Patescibacteria group bacterium]
MKNNPFELKIGKPVDIDWKEGSFLDFDQSSADPRFGHSTLDTERRPFQSRYFIIAVMAVLGIFVYRLSYLQIVSHERYLALAEGNRLREQMLLAPRGLIYDRNRQELVRNEPSFELVLTPLDLPRDENVKNLEIIDVSKFFGLEEEAVRQIVAGSSPESFFPITLKQSVEREKAIIFITQESSYPGFSIQNNPERFYIDGEKFSHIFGYTGKLTENEYDKLKSDGYLYNDILGKDGLEAQYEEFLRGVLGKRLVEVDAKGFVKNTFQQKDPKPGSNLHLNLDAELQRVLYDSLVSETQAHRATKAAAVAIDPKTGGILALVNIPSFDNNLFAKGISLDDYARLITDPNQPLFNRATSGTYPPGSTVKPLLAAAALQENVIKESTRIFDGGQIVVPNQYNPGITYVFHGWKRDGLGSMDVYSAIAMSSDIYFYTVGGGQENLNITGMGANRVADYFKKFFLGQTTGIDLPAEKAGLIPTPEWKSQRFAGNAVEEMWFLGDTYNMSIGQGFVLVSPLQLTVATAAIANGGKVMRPRFVSEITDRDGNLIKKFEPEILNSGFINPEYIEMAKRGMRQTITAGTARILESLPIAVAGKTGTSQFDGSDLRRTHAWFTSFAPYDDPKIVLTVLVEAGGEGSSAAVPVARDVYEWYAKNRM